MVGLPMHADTISREELKAKLDRGEALRLVMVHGRGAFDALHIPGSVFVTSLPEAYAMLGQEEDIVVYCSSEVCPRGWGALGLLRARGYRNVRYYRGGLADWEAAGYPLVGALASGIPAHQSGGV